MKQKLKNSQFLVLTGAGWSQQSRTLAAAARSSRALAIPLTIKGLPTLRSAILHSSTRRSSWSLIILLAALFFPLTSWTKVALAETKSAAIVKLSPKDAVQDTITKVVDVAEQLQGEKYLEERRRRLKDVISPRFDFEEMAKRSLGAYWNEISATEQQEFVDLFSVVLARTYLSKIETVKRGMVRVDSETIEGPKALVRTSVESKGSTFPLDYKLINDGGNWKVYDVIIENIGLVANYRNEFAGIIRKEKFTGLMGRLRKKNA